MNNLIFFDNPAGAVMKFVAGARHMVRCVATEDCGWTVSGSSLMDTQPRIMEHLRGHDIAVHMAGKQGPIN